MEIEEKKKLDEAFSNYKLLKFVKALIKTKSLVNVLPQKML